MVNLDSQLETHSDSRGAAMPRKTWVILCIFGLLFALASALNPFILLVPCLFVALVCLNRWWKAPQIFLWALAIPFAFALWQFTIFLVGEIFRSFPEGSATAVGLTLLEVAIVAAIIAWAVRSQSRPALITLAVYQIAALVLGLRALWITSEAPGLVAVGVHFAGLGAVIYALSHFNEWKLAKQASAAAAPPSA